MTDCTVETVLGALAPALVQGLERWRRGGFAPLRQAWLERAGGLGGPIRVRLPREEFTGIFRDLDGNGSLIVEQTGGGLRTVTAGEVFLPQE